MARTDRQEGVMESVRSEEFKDIIKLFERISQEAKNSVVELPYKNERGEAVIQGDNNYMRTVSETLDYALSCMSRFE